MASLAGLLQTLGYRITGSDQNVYPPMSTLLENLGIPILPGYRKENLVPRPDLVIVGNVMSPNAEESIALLASDIPRMSFPQALAEFVIQDRKSLVIAGTHGKTTTTAMVSWIAENCGVKPGFLVGGIPKNFNRSFQNPEGKYFVVEGDEYETCFFDKGSKFMHYRPFGAILHRVEMDHIEYFKTFERLKAAFAGFLRIVPKEGILLVFAEADTNRELLSESSVERTFTFGWNQGDYQARNVERRGVEISFDIFFREQLLKRASISMFGDYNVLNALAAFALTTQEGWDPDQVVAALASFQGVKRRQEVIGEPRGILIIEDFAHHPTAVAETVRSIKERFPTRRLVAVFEPRSATSCRSIFQEPYRKAFQGADHVVIVPPNAFREIPLAEQLNSNQLVEEMKADGIAAFGIREVDQVVKHLADCLIAPDIVLIMSNGAFGGIYKKLLQALA